MAAIKKLIKLDSDDATDNNVYIDGKDASGNAYIFINNKCLNIEFDASIELEIIPSEYGAVYEIESVTVDAIEIADAHVMFADRAYDCQAPTLTDDDTARIKQIIDDLIVCELDTMDCDDVVNNYCDYA